MQHLQDQVDSFLNIQSFAPIVRHMQQYLNNNPKATKWSIDLSSIELTALNLQWQMFLDIGDKTMEEIITRRYKVIPPKTAFLEFCEAFYLSWKLMYDDQSNLHITIHYP